VKQKTLALPIRTTDYSDSSQVASLFTRETGLVEVIVKGAYRPRNAFQGPLDLAVLREVVYVERRAPALSILAESEVLDGYRGLRASWRRHAAASQVIELIRWVATGGEPAHELFDLTAGTLERLDAAPLAEVSAWVLRFELRALRVLGFLGAIDSCVACNRLWPGEGRGAYFSARAGGLVCSRCRSRGRAAAAVTALPGRAVRSLQRFADDLPPAGGLEDKLARQLHRVLSESCAFHLERPFRMLPYSAAWL